jgi:hypothetical protein
MDGFMALQSENWVTKHQIISQHSQGGMATVYATDHPPLQPRLSNKFFCQSSLNRPTLDFPPTYLFDMMSLQLRVVQKSFPLAQLAYIHLSDATSSFSKSYWMHDELRHERR